MAKKKRAAKRVSKRSAAAAGSKKAGRKKATASKKVRKKAAGRKSAQPSGHVSASMGFEQAFANAPPEVLSMAKRLYKMIRELMPGATATVHGAKIPTVLFYGPGPVCGLQVVGERVNFYITRGTEVDDPKGLLEGKGKGIRHVKVASDDEAPMTDLRALLEAAVALG